MTSPDDPEGQTSIHTLSPVSPKPVHFPDPSNIPILENQMDATFSLSTTESEQTHDQNQENGFRVLSTSYGKEATDQEEDSHNSHEGHDVGGQGAFEPTDGRSMSAGSRNEDGKPMTFPDASAGPSNGTYHSMNEALSTSDQANVFSFQTSDQSASPYEQSGGVSYQDGQNLSTNQSGEYQSHGVDVGDAMNNPAVNLQALLDNLSTASASHSSGPYARPDADAHRSETGHSAVNGAGRTVSVDMSDAPTITQGAPAGLPPRPPPQESYNDSAPGTDIRAYHPHEQTSSAPLYVPPETTYHPPGHIPPPVLTASAPGANLSRANLPSSPIANFQLHESSNGQHDQPALYRHPSDNGDDNKIRHEGADLPWGPEVQRQYDAFLKDERMYVTEGQWDKFPANSRLFIGNLPTEKVTKRDLFHVFHKHGRLAQVSIKQAYGFIQYLDAQSCYRALQAEQGATIRGRKIHLEISKPQKNTKGSGGGNKAEGRESRNRRSRSPDQARGNVGNANQKASDRYRGAGNNRQRQRDDYRPGRSPSPRARENRRSPDRHGGRRRSRSRSPPGRGARRRSPSPALGLEDDCPLPRRDPRDVPDVQIIAKDEPDRNFITHVEQTFQARGLRTNIVVLNPRLSETSVVRRQIIEGVLAVMKLDRMVQVTQKFPLSIFDRSGGANNVRFEEYTNLDLNICVELVLRAKQTAQQRPLSSGPAFATSPYGLPMLQTSASQPAPFPQFPPPPPQHAQMQQSPNSATFPSSMDAASLQQILSRVQQQPQQAQQQNPYAPVPPAADLAKLLASAPQQQQQQLQQPQFANIANNPAFASLFAAAAGQQPGGRPQSVPQPQHSPTSSSIQHQQSPTASPGQQPDMSSIMAQLARYNGR